MAVKVFVEIALDHYGAESLGRLNALLDGLTGAGERHFQAWGGVGDAPQAEDYWSRRYPRWHSQLDLPYEEQRHGRNNLEMDRSTLAGDAASWVSSSEGRRQLDFLLRDLPKEELGPHATFDPVLLIAGSLAEPASSALLLGLLSGLARLRHLGVLAAPCHCICGIGAESGDGELSSEKARALAARALLDLENFFLEERGSPDRATPVFLVGEEASSERRTDRSTQVALAALTGATLTRSALGGHRQVSREHFNPFRFEVNEDRQAQQGNRAYDPGRPFAAVGAYAVYSPAERLTRLLASRFCRDCFKLLARQVGQGTLGEAVKVEPPARLATYLEEVSHRAVAHVWRRVSERRRIAWEESDRRRQPTEWFDSERIELLYAEAFETREWERFLQCYGEARMKALPLRRWQVALDELVEGIERGLVPRRQLQLDVLTRAILRSVLEGWDLALTEIFDRTFRRPIGSEPHRAAQAFLATVRRQLTKQQDEMEIDDALKSEEAEAGSLRKTLRRRREALGAALAAIPSPAAVLLRVLPLVSAATLVVLLLPMDLGPFDSQSARILAGLGAGGLASLLVFVSWVEQVRSRLLKRFREWMSLYRQILGKEDEALRRRTYRDLLGDMLECLEWQYSGDAESPPMPGKARIILKTEEEENGAPSDDELRKQTVVAKFDGYLRAACSAYDQLEERFLREFQASYAETILPEISIDRRDRIDREYVELLITEQQEEAALHSTLWKLRREWRETRPDEHQIFPFGHEPRGSERPSEEVSTWRRSFLVPPGRDLLSPEVLESSSGFRFFDAVRWFVALRIEEGLRLSSRLLTHHREVGTPSFTETSLYQRYSEMSAPSVRSKGGSLTRFVVAAGEGDQLASCLGWRTESALGADRLSIHQQVQSYLSGEEVIYYPNSDRPRSVLGKAWRVCESEKWSEPAYREVILPPEADR